MKKRIVLVVALVSISVAAKRECGTAFLWAGMETPLQIMIYGPGLGEGTWRVLGRIELWPSTKPTVQLFVCGRTLD